jgi:hypothetical protein
MINAVKKLLLSAMLAASVAGCRFCGPSDDDFLRVNGHDIVDGCGNKFFIRGINLGHWLNPEGYMFGFSKCNSAHMINTMFCELVGSEETKKFWRTFKENYITEKDIAAIASTGANTVRLPLHYKLFTEDEYLGDSDPEEGFKRIDDVVAWCRKYRIRVIIDMHSCPGGNTGDNIDDSYGFPWLFKEESYQKQYCRIWRKIAERYADEPVVLGYDLMNEPISSRLKEKDELNLQLERVQFMAIDAIRTVDRRHIVILAGAQWNGNFKVFTDFKKDPNMMYECHHYDFNNPKYDDARVQEFVKFRNKSGIAMFMGETGHNQHDWYRQIRLSMERNNMGWTFWTYKLPRSSGWSVFSYPDGWKETIVAFADGDRSTYAAIQKNCPDRAKALRLMREYVENCKAVNCRFETGYATALGLKEPME